MAAPQTRREIPVNEDTTDLDQTDEDILTYDVSDEALEAAAGTERGATPTPHDTHYLSWHCCHPH
jgi:hypothetical protein